MRENFERAFAAVIKHEGGYVDHPQDPGGATNLGITIGTLSGWFGRPASKAEVKALTVPAVKPIYRKNYWDKVAGNDLPSGVDYAVFDFAVNSGPKRAAISLQTILGVAPDGKVGPITVGAARAYADRFGAAQLANELCSHRLAFLEKLSTWPTFGKGWRSRVDGVREMAVEMAHAAPGEPEQHIPTHPLPPPKTHTSGPGIIGPIIIAVLILAAVAAFFLVRF